MEPIEYERIYQVENQHWWYLGMEAITRAILDHYGSPAASRKILDAGCGTGAAMSTYLANYGNVTGFDLSPLALRACQSRKLTSLARASVTDIPFQSDSFDLVTSFDVLYAVNKDSVAADEFFRVLRPGGLLFLRLPAYDWLRGRHDITVHTMQRYTSQKVTRLLINSGFRMVHLTYANTFLFPLAMIKRLSERIWPPALDSSDLSFPVWGLNEIFKQVLYCEAPLASHLCLPFGLSVVALGQKPYANE